MGEGILSASVFDTPIAVIDFETTGLSAGMDRVVEVSVMRREPGRQPEVVLDTLVNPRRPMGATEIHGITDADVADAPTFEEIARDVAAALSGCVFAAYNVYFDMRFFEYEMTRAGLTPELPYLCLMYLRPLLGLGSRCSLGDACQSHGIPYNGSHMAADDVESPAHLMEFYLGVMETKQIRLFRDLCSRGTYKFLRSFDRNPLRYDAPVAGGIPKKRRSRRRHAAAGETVCAPIALSQVSRRPCNGLAAYWDALKAAVTDLQIDDEEIDRLTRIVNEFGLSRDQVRMLHARAFASVITQFISDQCLDDRESRKLHRLHQCLSKLGWAPGE
jgi:DNA polymerase III epsilon subunit-like protein